MPFLMALGPEYGDAIMRRWQDWTGRTAIR